MLDGRGSSSDESEDDNFEKSRYKKVQYEGKLSESDSSDQHSSSSESHDLFKRNNYSKKISSLLKNDDHFQEKTKSIKKNCQSAKMSRHRKKLYLQALENKAEQLKRNIERSKNILKNNSQKIMQYITKSNKQKSHYLKEKLRLGKRLQKLTNKEKPTNQQMEEVKQIRSISDNEKEDGQNREIDEEYESEHIKKSELINSQVQNNESKPQQLEQPIKEEPIKEAMKDQVNESMKDQVNESMKQNGPKKKNEKNVNSESKIISEGSNDDREELLSASINSYLYQFGACGALKNDVIERSMNQWFDAVQSTKVLHPEHVKHHFLTLKHSFTEIERKSKTIDFLLRQLKQQIQPEFAVKFLIEKQFFSIQKAEEKAQELSVSDEKQ